MRVHAYQELVHGLIVQITSGIHDLARSNSPDRCAEEQLSTRSLAAGGPSSNFSHEIEDEQK